MITIGVMEFVKQITMRGIRQLEPASITGWTVSEVESGYLVRAGETVLYTVNGRKPRLFRTLDAAKQALAVEIGVTEFKVESLAMKA